jgi:ATP-dependent RNA helicase DeaD
MSDDAITFADMTVSQETLSSLEAMGYAAPTDCQRETIPLALAGRDLVVQSRTGTGKTAAFGVPIVERVAAGSTMVQALALTPTRELAVQVCKELQSIGTGRGVRTEAVYGGDPIERQLDALDAGPQVIAGTPGRVLDHLRRGSLDLSELSILVLDEADRMLDMGFAVEMSQIMRFVPEERQTLLFSATIPLGIRGLIYHYLVEPEWVLLSEDQIYVKEVDHRYCLLPRLEKEDVLYRLIELEEPDASMIFCNTREETRRVHAALSRRGLRAEMLSSDLPQRKREKVMDGLRRHAVRHLVTTDVASRGIDVEELSHVFIFSTPQSAEQYIHRAGRTGRIGRSGRVISLVSAHDLVSFNRLVKRYKIDVAELPVPSEEAVRDHQADRVVSDLAQRASQLGPETLVGHLPLVRRILASDQRERLVIALLDLHLGRPPVDEPDEEPEAGRPESRPHKGARRSQRRRPRSQRRA